MQLKLLHPRIMLCLQLFVQLGLCGLQGLEGLGLVLLERLQQRALGCAKCALSAVFHLCEGVRADLFVEVLFDGVEGCLGFSLDCVDLVLISATVAPCALFWPCNSARSLPHSSAAFTRPFERSDVSLAMAALSNFSS